MASHGIPSTYSLFMTKHVTSPAAITFTVRTSSLRTQKITMLSGQSLYCSLPSAFIKTSCTPSIISSKSAFFPHYPHSAFSPNHCLSESLERTTCSSWPAFFSVTFTCESHKIESANEKRNGGVKCEKGSWLGHSEIS